MGAFFSNIHIRKTDSAKLSDVEKFLCGEFKKMGFEQAADAKTADETVVLCEADGSSWITVCSGLFERRLSELSEVFKTDIMLIECCDSDFIEMNLVNADGTDAKVTIGRPYYGERENSYSEWEGKVSNLEKFIEVTNGDYVFAEDALNSLDELMGLPIVQGGMFGDYPPENGNGVTVKVLGFSVAEQATDKQPPKLCYFSRGGLPVPDRPCYGAFMISNDGGASKGLGIIFYGDYIENDDITFTDCLLHISGTNIPIELEKKKRDDGSFVLSWRGEDVVLPAAPDKNLSDEKRMQLKAERMISISYTPHGNFRKFLDIKICFAPLQNWHDGQCHAYIWKGYGSKRQFVDMYNEDMRDIRSDCGYYPEDPTGLFREEDYDLD